METTRTTRRRTAAKPRPFDRAARDELRRHPVTVVSSDARVMLVGDSRGAHVLVDPHSMRTVDLLGRDIFGWRLRRLARFFLVAERAQRRVHRAALLRVARKDVRRDGKAVA